MRDEKPPAEKPPIEVVIRHVTDLEEVVVTLADTATIHELKQLLAVEVERPELPEVGEIVRILPDGSTAPIKDSAKVGIRRLLGFKGCPLHPPLSEGPPLSLDDFLDFDPEEDLLSSPRSLRACHLEGVSPEDLIYVPISDFSQKAIEPRIAELWYDFFEALRQDSLRDCRAARLTLIAEEEGRSFMQSSSSSSYNPRIADTGGNWCGALEHSDNRNVQQFFRERNEMCQIDRVYKGATKPFRSSATGSRYFSQNQGYQDPDPITAADHADDAADKLDDLLQHYKRLPNCKKFVEEQRLNTESNAIVQYDLNTKRLHKDQAEYRRLINHRMDTEETQISLADGEVQSRNDMLDEMKKRDQESKTNITKLEVIRSVATNKRAAYFREMRDKIHQKKLDYQYFRCDELNNLTLHDQAVAERVHQHKSMKMIGFAREWTKRRVRWQLNHNSISQSRNEWNQATLDKQQAASDRVEAQRVIRQKWIEYRRELKTLQRVYADLNSQRWKARQDARRSAVANEFSRMALEEAQPSPSPLRRNWSLAMSTGSLASSGSMQMAGSSLEMGEPAPFSSLLKQPRVVKRLAKFEFPRMGSGMMSSTATSSTRSGNWSPAGATLRQSTSMQSLGGGNSTMDRTDGRRAM